MALLVLHQPSGSRVRIEARIRWLVCTTGDFVFATKKEKAATKRAMLWNGNLML